VEATCGFNNPSVALPANVNFSIMPSSNRDQFGTQKGTVTTQATSGSLTHTLVLPVTISYPDFTLTPASPTLTVPLLGAATDVVNVQPVWFFSSDVIFSCTTIGALTCSVNPLNSFVIDGGGPTPVTLTVTSTGSPVSTGSVTFQGTYTTLTHSVQIPVSVNNSDFTLSGDGPSLTMMSGQTLGMGINISPVQSFAGSVSFSCSGSPGLTCALSPNPITASPTGPVTSVLSVTSSDSAASGSVTITATSGSLSHTLQIPVTVTVVVPDFTVTTFPAALSLSSAQTGTSTITVTPIQGFTSDVGLTCAVSPSLAATTCSLSPASVTGGSGTSTLTVHAATLAMDRGAPLPFLHRGIGAYATFVFALGMVFTMKPRRSPRARSWRNRLLGLLLLGVMLGLVSCGGGGGGSTPHVPTPLSGTVTVTGGTGAGVTHSIAIPVTIN